jgi:hypothetical protein
MSEFNTENLLHAVLNENVENDTENVENETENVKNNKPCLELDCRVINALDLAKRLCLKFDRKTLHKLRQKYKSDLNLKFAMIKRTDLRNDENKLIEKFVQITIANDDRKIKFDLKSDLCFNVKLVNKNRDETLQNKSFDYLYLADHQPVKCVFIACILRLLKPYHTLKSVSITTKQSLSLDSLVINYKMTPYEIAFRTCQLVFNNDEIAFICTHLVMNALFPTKSTFDLCDSHLESKLELSILKTIENPFV